MILSTGYGEVAFYEATFPTGLRFSIHPTIKQILNFYDICPAQLSPNAWRSIISMLVIWRYYKCHMSLNEFRCLYALLKGPGSELGWLYFKARPGRNILKGTPAMSRDGRRDSSFSKRCNKVPILSKTEDKRFRRVFEKIGEKGHFKILVVLDSRTFHKYFALGRVEMSSSGGGSVEGDIGARPRRTKSNKGASNAAMRALALGCSSTLPGEDLGPGAWMMSSALVVQKILNVVILYANKDKVDKFTTDELVTKSFHALGSHARISLTLRNQEHQNDLDFQIACTNSVELELVKAQNRAPKAESQLVELGEQTAKSGAELKDKFKAMARLEAEVAELTRKLALAKKLILEDFKSSDDFKDAVTHPNVGVDMASMKMDADLVEKEEVANMGEKKDDNEGEAIPTP
ncbi:hypothetical protein Acr_14g0000530 [Actinidia rufa]|uniref:Transposase (putative) gypsy type domain-containing protein n=1 Tax=Actinidia rufa TaxID=165716 RepID=A0A7J0FPU4_9ERIC|nr:hypothetical protein Acr_14g0000530 [Actinidia rufa]